MLDNTDDVPTYLESEAALSNEYKPEDLCNQLVEQNQIHEVMK